MQLCVFVDDIAVNGIGPYKKCTMLGARAYLVEVEDMFLPLIKNMSKNDRPGSYGRHRKGQGILADHSADAYRCFIISPEVMTKSYFKRPRRRETTSRIKDVILVSHFGSNHDLPVIIKGMKRDGIKIPQGTLCDSLLASRVIEGRRVPPSPGREVHAPPRSP